MRKLLCILFATCSMACNAQWFDWQQGQQQVEKSAKLFTDVLFAKMSIADGNYDSAYETLEEIADESREAACLLGACYELGMGTSVDHDLAEHYYSKGGSDGRAALNRIE